MLPKTFYKHFGIRIKSMELGLGTYFVRDSENEKLLLAPPYQIINMWNGFIGAGIIFCVGHGVHMYQKTHPDEIEEEGGILRNQGSSLEFATRMIEGGEILTFICLQLLNYVCLKRLDTCLYLYNQLLEYNKRLTGMIEAGELVLSDDQNRVIWITEILRDFVMIVSGLLPFAVSASIFSTLEPTNEMIRDWFEVPFSFSLPFSPLIVTMLIGGWGAGSTVGLMVLLINIYYVTSTITTECFTPESIRMSRKLGSGRCIMETQGFGAIQDVEVIKLYRTQQLLNGLMNEFFKSRLISFHHVGCLATVVVCVTMLCRYQSALQEMGVVGYLVVISSMLAPIMLIWYQATMIGAVVDISEDFKTVGETFIPKKTVFKKFQRSCTTFYIHVAYPFYTIGKDTFTEFMQASQDYSMEMLLW